ncbi:MAG: alpha-ketoglutarate-dependent dioxygenase AlkB [Acidobacteriia bacterium]|nr:alpha-ketoglutarate-dependent dioxygenase AlkB [Terriglobia bacterium]
MGSSITSGTLFPIDNLPEGLLYQADFLSEAEEADLVRIFRELPFQAFDFHGYIAKRRVLEFGFEYDFTTRRATPTQSFPVFLSPMRERAARFAGISAADLVEGMVTEYSSGAPIGWHRDAPQFGAVIGISLAGTSRMRFKPYKAEGKPVALTLERRSIYVMRGPARWKFQHSIPPVKELRYSITFRTLHRREAKTEAA